MPLALALPLLALASPHFFRVCTPLRCRMPVVCARACTCIPCNPVRPVRLAAHMYTSACRARCEAPGQKPHARAWPLEPHLKATRLTCARTGRRELAARRWALWWAVSASCSAGTSRPFSKSTAAVLAVRCVRPLCLSLRQLPPLLFPASLPLSPLVSAWCGRLLCLSLQKLLLPPSRPPPPPPSFYLLSSLSPRFESTVDDGWAWQVRVLNEQFIELFDTDLVTIDQSRRPSWL